MPIVNRHLGYNPKSTGPPHEHHWHHCKGGFTWNCGKMMPQFFMFLIHCGCLRLWQWLVPVLRDCCGLLSKPATTLPWCYLCVRERHVYHQNFLPRSQEQCQNSVQMSIVLGTVTILHKTFKIFKEMLWSNHPAEAVWCIEVLWSRKPEKWLWNAL